MYYNKMYIFISICCCISLLLLLLLICILYNRTANITKTVKRDIPVFLVSLEKDNERRKNVYKFITPNAYYGVNGQYLNKEILRKKGILDKNVDLKKGEIGCYISHMNILNEIILSDYKYALLIEDDIDYNEEIIHNLLNDIYEILPDNFDILHLGHNYYEESDDVNRLIIKDIELKKVKISFGTHCYLVNVNNIRNKLEKLYPIKQPYDMALPLYMNTYIVEKQSKPLVNVIDYKFSNTQGIS